MFLSYANQPTSVVSSLATAGATSVGTASSNAEAATSARAPRVSRGMTIPKIKDIGVIEVQIGTRLSVLKITTDQPGLYGYGCATFTQRADVIKPAVELYLKPLQSVGIRTASKTFGRLVGIASVGEVVLVLQNGISGVDEGLWDIKRRLFMSSLVEKCARPRKSIAMRAVPRPKLSSIRFAAWPQQALENVHIQSGGDGGANDGGAGRGATADTPPARTSDALHYGIKALNNTVAGVWWKSKRSTRQSLSGRGTIPRIPTHGSAISPVWGIEIDAALRAVLTSHTSGGGERPLSSSSPTEQGLRSHRRRKTPSVYLRSACPYTCPL